MPKGFASARFTDRVKLARFCGDRKGPGHGDTHNLFVGNKQGVTGSDALVGLHGVVGIARRAESMDPPYLESEALAVGQCDVKSLK